MKRYEMYGLVPLALVALAPLLLFTLTPPVVSQEKEIPPPDSPEVQVAEVLRRGDMVTSCGEGPRSGPEVAYAAAMAPPANDKHLWNVTLWTTPGCQACEHLKSDFRKAPELLAFVAPPSPNALPWAHYTEYSSADATQTDRRIKYKVTRYPTLVIQPPRNGMWGDPGLIVAYEIGYAGDAKALSKTMQAKVRFFAEVQNKKGFPREVKLAPQAPPPPERVEPMGGEPESKPQGAGAMPLLLSQVSGPPPFQTPPAVDPFNPQPPSQQPTPVTTWPPVAPTPQPAGPANPLLDLVKIVGPLLGYVLPSGMTLTWVLLAVQTGLWFWEIRAKRTATPLDDQAIAFIRSVLSGQTPTPPQVQAAQTVAVPPVSQVPSAPLSRT